MVRIVNVLNVWDCTKNCTFALFVRQLLLSSSLDSALTMRGPGVMRGRDSPCESGIVEGISVDVDFEEDVDVPCS